MPKFGRKSKERLSTCDEDLQDLFNEVIKYVDCSVLEGNRSKERQNKLYDEGWYVIYWTARGGSEKSKQAGKCYYDFTWKQLESWGCKFHDLSTGSKGSYVKPACDLVIDDKAKRIEEI